MTLLCKFCYYSCHSYGWNNMQCTDFNFCFWRLLLRLIFFFFQLSLLNLVSDTNKIPYTSTGKTWTNEARAVYIIECVLGEWTLQYGDVKLGDPALKKINEILQEVSRGKQLCNYSHVMLSHTHSPTLPTVNYADQVWTTITSHLQLREVTSNRLQNFFQNFLCQEGTCSLGQCLPVKEETKPAVKKSKDWDMNT